ncbi:carbohydrate kinase family protein [Nanoarchaeota archaeon NZ13-N]|nr:MAG: carbohydrate kinase family protein [Nanoarchaeota archaeon NZ13-N]
MITSLPDLFIDIIVKPIEKLDKRTGNIRSIAKMKIGGNAANFSIALGKLGIKNNLIACLGELSYNLFKSSIEKYNVTLYPYFTSDNITVSLEEEDRVMLTDSRGIQVDKIEEYREIIKRSKYIFFGNWNNNKKSNDLLKWITEVSNAKIYLDIGDPSINKENINELIRILKSKRIWVLSLNEHEVSYLSNYLGIEGDNYIEIANKLFREINVENLDVHSSDFVYSLPSKAYLKIEKVRPKILTGAGDTWNAANFYGYYKGLNDEERLKFANEVAKSYILEEF